MNDFSRHRFSELLQACHDIIRNNDKLSPEASFDEISKILFVKILNERVQHETYTKEKYLKEQKEFESNHDNKNKPYHHFLFEQVKEGYKTEGVFNKYESIRVRETSFIQIIEQLQTYNLSEISDDLKGIAFEQFLGKTFRGELGQFFTPRTIVDFMVASINPKEGELICDPCCGSGGFLIKTFEYIKEKIEQTSFETKEIFQQRLKHLAQNCIFGTDANPRMARTSKMNMIMHGDGHSGIHLHDGLLNVNGIFENRFDVVLTNPPFGSKVSKSLLVSKDDKFTDEKKIQEYIDKYGEEYKVALQQVNDNIDKPILDLFLTGKYSGGGLTEALFVERSLNLLKPGGRMAIVLPEGILSNNNLSEFRSLIEGMAKIIFIVSLPKDAFLKSGASVKTSVLFLRKFTKEESYQYQECISKAERECMSIYYPSIGAEWSLKIKNYYLRKLDKQQKEQYKAEVRNKIKQLYDYDVLVSSVNSIGISSSLNELSDLQDYFTSYCSKHKLW